MASVADEIGHQGRPARAKKPGQAERETREADDDSATGAKCFEQGTTDTVSRVARRELGPDTAFEQRARKEHADRADSDSDHAGFGRVAVAAQARGDEPPREHAEP